jgi:hypothetical protein
MKTTWLFTAWQDVVLACALGFTRVGQARFVQWVTGIALSIEEHTITQSLIALDAPSDWKALESFAEYGSWHLPLLQCATASLATAPEEQRWFGFHVWAGDDTKVHRKEQRGLGRLYFPRTLRSLSQPCQHGPRSQLGLHWCLASPRRATTYLPTFLPTSGGLYFLESQLPAQQHGPPIVFLTKNQIMVHLARQNANAVTAKHLLVVDGGYCRRNVLRPLLCPEADSCGQVPPRVDVITRLRCDACLHAVLQDNHDKRRKWGPRLPRPSEAESWPGSWQVGRAYVYGQWREIRYKEALCCWRALGHDVVVKVVLARVEGYKELFTLLCTATQLTALAVVEIFCARSRQEDGIRDLKQRLGWEECRAWTRNPIERTTQVLFVALSAMRLLQEKLSAEQGDEWWFHPPWNKGKQRASVLDVQRLLWQHRDELQRLLSKFVQDTKLASAGGHSDG